MIASQELAGNLEVETVLIDSGSTDRTLEIAREFNCKITYIDKSDFSFGRSLNMGSDYSSGDISGLCIESITKNIDRNKFDKYLKESFSKIGQAT